VSRLVLIVEDEPLILESLQFLLESSGLLVATATDGKQAILSIQQLRPRLVILDVKMQHHSGFEVLKMIRADPELNETRVLILTAMRLKEEYRKAIELGADKFVTKPFSN
jgi:two-component system OmpR family response regulator